MTVPNFRPSQSEKLQYITPDGVVYNLHNPPDRSVLLYEGDGFPPVNFGTTRGPYQHGYSVTEGRVDARTINMTIRQNGCDRDAYWALRRTIDGILRYNRTNLNNPQPGILRRVTSDGLIRDLDCYVSKGPLYSRNGDGWDEFSFQESLKFTAYNPIFYDPTVFSASVVDFTPTPAFVQNLICPFSFPFLFGIDYTVITKTFSLAYNGNWEEYPTIIVTGPATDFKIQHNELGTLISLNGFTIPAGVVVTFDLTYAHKTVLDGAGVSWQGALTDDSNLVAFRLEADPIVLGGINTFSVSMTLGSVASQVEIRYKNRYIGLD
jgi:hypothetical protein